MSAAACKTIICAANLKQISVRDLRAVFMNPVIADTVGRDAQNQPRIWAALETSPMTDETAKEIGRIPQATGVMKLTHDDGSLDGLACVAYMLTSPDMLDHHVHNPSIACGVKNVTTDVMTWCNSTLATWLNKMPSDIIGTPCHIHWGEKAAALYNADDRDVLRSGRPRMGYPEMLGDGGDDALLETCKFPLDIGDGYEYVGFITKNKRQNLARLKEQAQAGAAGRVFASFGGPEQINSITKGFEEGMRHIRTVLDRYG